MAKKKRKSVVFRQLKKAVLVILPVVGVLMLVVVTQKHLSKNAEEPKKTEAPNAGILLDQTYTNKKLGFQISYPKLLKLTPKEVDIKADSREYSRKCDLNILDGCGGGRWPDFKISFLRPNSKAAFDVNVYQMPMLNYQKGGIENSNFTYYVSTFRFFDEDTPVDPVDKETLKAISSTLTFIEPLKSLGCLWSIETGKIFDTTSEYVRTRRQDLSYLEGYYYDEVGNLCSKTSYYTWKGQEEANSLPFKDLSECHSSCIR